MMTIRIAMLILVTLWLGSASPARGQDDVADVPSQDLKIGDDANKRYFLIGPKEKAKVPEKGFGLVLIMPGGDGSAEFHPFVKRIFKNALPDGYIAVQPVAVKWTPDQEIVWPTEKSKVKDMKFTTEQFVEEIVKDVGKKQKIDPARVFTLSWSSSGPAAYAISLQKDTAVTGSFVAMSVFKPDSLPTLKQAKDRAYYIYHSPDDKVCPPRMAEQARDDLKKNGAKVKFETYSGGHGWKGPVYKDIKAGIEWLEKNHAKPAKP